ncbi:MAG: porin family protein [Bradyrhizobiaceae bacterium]|nr:MAG: porin family protein [Bradyrhizobiaceae bacterium]
MRRMILAAVIAGSAHVAQAADMPDFSNFALRGPVNTGVVNWQGFYFGGQAGYGSTDMNFKGSNSGLIREALGPNNIITDTALSVAEANGKVSVRSTTFGGFAGYNNQWDDVVLGVEANYMHGKSGAASTAAPVPLTYVNPFSDGLYHTIGVVSSQSVSITDMGTIRGRAGYVVGNFLPYVFGGLSLGRADISSYVTITDRSADTFAGSSSAPATTYAANESTTGKMLYGYTAGLGTEVMLGANIFGRLEWEYLRFVNAGPDVNINTVRGGVGYKF